MENPASRTDLLGNSSCSGSPSRIGGLALLLVRVGWLVGVIGVFLTTSAASAAYKFPSEDAAREVVGDIVETLVADQFAPDPCEILVVPDVRGGTILEPHAIDQIVKSTLVAVQASAFGKDCLVTSALSSQLDPAINNAEALVVRFREEGRRGLVLSLEYYKLSDGVIMMGQLEDIQQGLFISGSGRHQLPQANSSAGAEPELSPVSLSTPDATAQPAEDTSLSIDRSFEARTFTVYFELGQSSLDETGQQIVREAATYAKSLSQIEIYVEGHTDSSGSPEVNYRVAADRAQSVLDGLRSEAGDLSEFIRTVEFGEDRPVVATGPNVRESKNRRVEITIAPISNTLRIGGTGLALGGLQILANAFMAENPNVDIEIPPSLGSGGGIKALLADAIDLSVSTRPPKEKEEAKGVTAFRYGRTPFVFATSEENDIDGVTTRQLADFYSGRVTRWPNGRDIHLVLRPPGRSTNKTLKKMSAAMSEAIDIALAKPDVVPATTDQDSVDAIEQRVGALGTTTLGMIRAEGRALKPLALDGIAPTVENLTAGLYPLERSLYLVLGPEPNRAEEAFAAFLKSSTAHYILNKTGYVVDNKLRTHSSQEKSGRGAWLAPKSTIGEDRQLQ